MQGIFNAGFLLFHFNFGRSANFDYRNAACQFRYALLQFFTIVVGGRFFNLLTDLSNTALDGSFFTHAINDGGGVFVDHNTFRLTQVFQGCFFQLHTDLFRDYGTAGQGSDILQHRLTTIAEARCFNRSHFHDATHGVHYQGSQRFAFNIFSDDQQRFACFCNGFQNRQHFADVGDFLISQQDERAFQFYCASFRLVDEVRRQVAAVKLHTFNHVQFVLQTGTVFNGDDAFFTDFIHRFRDQFTYGFVGVSGDSTYLSNRFRVGARYGQRLQLFNRRSNRFVDTTFQVHRVHARSNGFQAFGNDGLRQYGRGGGAVACSVVRFRGNFFHHLRAHVFKLVFQFDFTRYGNTIFSDSRRTERFIQNHVTAFRTEGYFHCICQYVYAAQHFHTSVVTEFYVFSCHFLFPLNSYVQCRSRITLQQLPECRFQT
ncbi:Uncharacterised protein [Salmonella enterica subsp. enterica serovar Bovismorbificans]|uniref:Uncharacterized protein n=1 Tax=Salmonella enterica subsp. enterica serovar Bovismorbificans TaxID=58097 RepID=A0A655E0M5_SALET|nr:Uncharacterised protein [Salmonella enterica subsp. enterica serovar Bovismorbificans]